MVTVHGMNVKREKKIPDDKAYLYSENHGRAYGKQLLVLLWFNPIDWITEQDIFQLPVFMFLADLGNLIVLLCDTMLLGKPVISAALHCPVSSELLGFGGIESFGAESKRREIIPCSIAEVLAMTVHSGAGGWKGEGLPPSVSLCLSQAASKLTVRREGWETRKERFLFLEGEQIIQSICKNLGMVISYSKHT